jgi:hypothetical protein
MTESDPEAYELHARRFLDLLQTLAGRFSGSEAAMDQTMQQLAKCWPQILAAFRWSSNARAQSAAAAEICDALLACADGDIVQLQSQRNAVEVKRWAEEAANQALRQENPNDAAFLYRFAGIAKVQSAILEVAHDTRRQATEVLRELAVFIDRNRKD